LGQIEVFEFLREQRANGNEQFWTCSEIKKACKERGFSSGMIESIKGNLLKLELSHYLDGLVQKNGWNRAWRIKMKYVKKATGRAKEVKGVK
jgi:hypothetical protein